MSQSSSRRAQRVLKIIPPLITLCLVVLLALWLRGMTLDELLHYVPQSYLPAVLVFLAFYGVKSLSVVFPLSVLYLAAGLVFPFWGSVGVTVGGLMVSITLPYLIGWRWGEGLIQTLTHRYPKVERLFSLGVKNEVLVAYLMRIVGVLPGDLCSLFLGACRMNYWRYALGSLLGLAPVMLLHLILVQAVDQELGLHSVALAGVLVGISILSTLLFNRHSRGS